MYEDQNMYQDELPGFQAQKSHELLAMLGAMPAKKDLETIRKLEEAKKEEERQARITQTLALGESLGKRMTDETREKVMEDPNNPELETLRKSIARGSKLDELMQRISPYDIEKQMKESVYGKPAKSALGKIGQALFKGASIAGGAPAEFGKPAMDMYLKMEEQARKGRQTDYTALQGGARINQQATASQNKTLADLAKINSMTTLGVVRELNKDFREGENVEFKQEALKRQTENWNNLSDIQREKIRGQFKHWDDLNRQNPYGFAEAMAKKSPDEAALIYAALGLTEAVKAVGKSAGAPPGGGNKQSYTGQTTRFVKDMDGNFQAVPGSIYTRTPTGGGGTIENPQIEALRAKAAGLIVPAMPGQPQMQAPVGPAPQMPANPQGLQAQMPAGRPQAAQFYNGNVQAPKGPASAGPLKLQRVNQFGKPWAPIYDKTTADDLKNIANFGGKANTITKSILEGFQNGTLDDTKFVLSTMSRMQEELARSTKGSLLTLGKNPSVTYSDISGEYANDPKKRKVIDALRDLNELTSLRVKEWSGLAASDQERSWIANTLPRVGDDPTILLNKSLRMSAGSALYHRMQELGIKNIAPQKIGNALQAIEKWSENQVKAAQKDKVDIKGGAKAAATADIDVDKLLMSILDADDAQRFNLRTTKADARKMSAIQQFNGLVGDAKEKKDRNAAIQRIMGTLGAQ